MPIEPMDLLLPKRARKEGQATERSAPLNLTNDPLHTHSVHSGKRADAIWTRGDFLAICEYMHNENSHTHFLSAWRDMKGVHYSKSSRVTVQSRASWAWDTITGIGKGNTSIGFYPSNPNGLSHWGAIDFDAHDGNWERATRLSRKAHMIVRAERDLFTILSHSGRGYHLFVFFRDFKPLKFWILLLREICRQIDVGISPSVCEIFPNDRAESQRTGRAIRAPGTFNPSTGQPSLIEYQNITPLLDSLPRSWSAVKPFRGRNATLSLHTSIYNYSSGTQYHSPSTETLIEKTISSHPVERVGTRNGVLMQLIGDLVHKFGRQASEEIIKLHYEKYRSDIRTAWDDHHEEFCNAWNGMVAAVVERFNAAEREKYDSLNTEHQHEGFRIVRSFAGAATHQNKPDYPVARASLADRLSITPQGASEVIGKLIVLKTITLSQPYRPHTQPAHYRWFCPIDSSPPLKGLNDEILPGNKNAVTEYLDTSKSIQLTSERIYL